MEQSIWIKLCNRLSLGNLIDQPVSIQGGLMHRMYKLDTTVGTFAVKALNPEIMKRPNVFNNYQLAENVSLKAKDHVMSVPALRWNNEFMIEVDGHYFLLFPWVIGKSLYSKDITIEHCKQIGSQLAKLHQIDFSPINKDSNTLTESHLINWDFYIHQGMELDMSWCESIANSMEDLKKWNKLSLDAQDELSSVSVISHRDLDPKNVLWNNNQPIIIDWESAGFIHPLQDLIDTAVYWSNNEDGTLNSNKFKHFIMAYLELNPTIEDSIDSVLNIGYLGKLEWLEYNLKRSLLIECSDTKEQELGIEQVIYTLESLYQYQNNVANIKQWFTEIIESNK